MSTIDNMLEYNLKFVEEEKYKQYESTKYPNKKTAVLSCMDTRLMELLPAALNFKNGDIHVIKTAGAVVSHPFGSVMRSLLLAIYDLNIEEILVIGHSDCGMQGLDTSKLIQKMLDRNIPKTQIEMINYCGIDFCSWLKGFENAEESVAKSVSLIRNHPLVPKDINIHGFLMCSETGKLTKVPDC
ncbi:carbonic anhydrase [Geobacter sp. SVR]|uniref:beta-class carbonic anhydrase n=1 Tax=Geobacter sp. SVR TaxID=2495594 RepID=UPI00143EF61F|nr:carbonic anhydrase [Geobacter sp. SVR]BCS53417.1 carbonic anhydrase [Geobacter sp. SVR]GCF85457.1 carbonic anhydrase [Geobacter sp. SVR]